MKDILCKILKKLGISLFSHYRLSIIIILLFLVDFFFDLDGSLKQFLLKNCVFSSEKISLILSNMRGFFSGVAIVCFLVFLVACIFDNAKNSEFSNIKNPKIKKTVEYLKTKTLKIGKTLVNINSNTKNSLFYLIVLQIACFVSIHMNKTIVFLSLMIINIPFFLYCAFQTYYTIKKVERYNNRSKEFVLIFILMLMFVLDILFPVGFSFEQTDNTLLMVTHTLGYFGVNGLGFLLEHKANKTLDDILKDGFWGFTREDLLIALNHEMIFLSSEIMMILKYSILVIIILSVVMQRFLILTVSIILAYFVYEEIKTKSYLDIAGVENEQIKAIDKMFDDYFADYLKYKINPLEKMFAYINSNLENQKDYSEINRIIDTACNCVLRQSDFKSLEKMLYNTYQICKDLPHINSILSRFFVAMSRTMKEKETYFDISQENLNRTKMMYEYFVYVFVKLIIFQINDKDELKNIIKNSYHLELYERTKFINIFIWLYGFYQYEEHIFNPKIMVSEQVENCKKIIEDLFYATEFVDKVDFISNIPQIYIDFPQINIAQLLLSEELYVENKMLIETFYSKILIMDNL